MKLTHENVRRTLTDTECGNGDMPGEFNAVVRALCEQWLAAHTVRWVDVEMMVDGIALPHFKLRRLSDGEDVADMTGFDPSPPFRGWLATTPDGARASPPSESEARAWCEEQARAEGYEVER